MKLAIFAVLLAASLCAAEKSHHKRQIFPGYGGLGYGGLGYGGYGYGLGGFGGVGYPGYGYGAGFIGRKRRDTADAEHHEEHSKEKRQVFPGYGGLGYGGYGLGYGGYGLGYGGVGYPGVYGGYGAGFIGRKRRDTADVEHHDTKEKRQIFPGYGGLGYGGYGLGYGYGAVGYPAVGYGLGYGAGFIGRKRRDVDDVESHKDKRQVLLGGLGYPGYGYGGFGYGGYGLGLGAVNTGFGYPAIYGRKRRDTVDVEHHDHDDHHKEKRQILGGYGLGYGGFGYGGFGYPGYGLGYGAVNTGFGYPAIYGRKRRDTEDVEHHDHKEHKEKRQILAGGFAPVVGAGFYGAPIVGAPLVGAAPFVGAPFVGGYGYPVAAGVGPAVIL